MLPSKDQGIVRGRAAALLSLHHDIEVVVEVERGDQVVAAAGEHRPDVALLDIEMAVPGCQALILTTFGRPGYLRRAMDLGAYGFLVKDSPAGELAAAIRRAAAGQRTVGPAWPPPSPKAPAPCPSARGGAGRRPRRRHRSRDRRPPLPVGGDGPQPPLGRDPQDRARSRLEALRTAEDKGWL